MTTIESIADIAFEVAHESLATIAARYPTLFSGLLDKLQDAFVFFRSEMHIRIRSSSAYRKYGNNPPVFHPFIYQKLPDGVKMGIIAAIDAGKDIKLDFGMRNQKVDGLRNHLETMLVAPHPVVLIAQSIHTDGHSMESGIQ